MTWRDTLVAPAGTHHVGVDGAVLYEARFERVLKFHAPGLAPVRRDGRAWHIRLDGGAAYDRRFDETFGFYEGLAAVRAEDGWHHIDVTGDDAYAQRLSWCGNFQEGLCPVRNESGRYYHIDAGGVAVTGARWRYAGDFRDGVAVVQEDAGRSTHVDRRIAPLHGRWFLDLDVFHKGFARARDEAGWTHVDRRGVPAYERRFAMVEPFYNGQARVERLDGGIEVIDEVGRCLLEVRSATRSAFAELSADLVGFWRTRTIAAAVELAVFDALPGTLDELAASCQLQPAMLGRLLRALGEIGLVESSAGRWRSTDKGGLLSRGHALTLADAALEYAGPFDRMWAALAERIRLGRAAGQLDIWGQVAADAGRVDGHHRMLRSYARHDYADIVRHLDLRGDEHVVDAGGGLGVLAGSMLKLLPELRVTLLERPEVVEAVRRSQGDGARLQLKAADIFSPWPVRTDVVTLCRVLHDWDDELALEVLRQARSALGVGGRVVVIEMVLSDMGFGGGLCDLHLLMATGGRERSADEYQRLLRESGFEPVAVRRLPSLVSAIEGVAR